MIDLKNRKRDKYGNIILTEDGILNLLYSGEMNITELLAEPSNDITLFNKWANLFDEDLINIYEPPTESIEDFDEKYQTKWFIPDNYKNLDIKQFLLNKCKTTEEENRVNAELVLFEERKMIIILCVLIYLVDIMRERNIVWGVGRGSACASYCLYLIGIHKVNSLKYNLDIKEFLK